MRYGAPPAPRDSVVRLRRSLSARATGDGSAAPETLTLWAATDHDSGGRVDGESSQAYALVRTEEQVEVALRYQSSCLVAPSEFIHERITKRVDERH